MSELKKVTLNEDETSRKDTNAWTLKLWISEEIPEAFRCVKFKI
jgi:hypothetical protein